MEEWVGQWWHRVVTRLADRQHPQAAVRLEDMRKQLGVIFRGMGGLPAWRLSAAAERTHQGPRGLLQKIAGTGERFAQPVLDAETLALPPVLALFDQAELNRELYLWLAAQGAMRLCGAVHDGSAMQEGQGGCAAHMSAPEPAQDWLSANLQASRALLTAFPGWWPRYRRLVTAHLDQRPSPSSLKGRQADGEARVQAALRASLEGDWSAIGALAAPLIDAATPAKATPTANSPIPLRSHDLMPVCLWVDVSAAQPPMLARERPVPQQSASREEAQADPALSVRRRAQQTDAKQDKHALMMFFRAESLLSWADLVRVNRQTDDDELADPSQIANDMDSLSIAPDGQSLASRVRFDLDLPSSAADDAVIEQGIRLPEWDHRKARLLPDHCSVQVLAPTVHAPWLVPPTLKATAARMRRRLESLRALPRWQSGHADGERLDVDAWVRWQAEAGGGQGEQAVLDEPRVFARAQRCERSLSTLLLADLSLSTDAWASQDARVIDVIRDALYVFGQAMDGLGDPFAIMGFSSVKRHNVRVHALKRFDEGWQSAARDRIGAIKPGYYTRMGAAIRYATRELAQASRASASAAAADRRQAQRPRSL
ncbi:MAG: VWA domain-containing protein [Aquabacterium sp.]